jgi:hypothetical protein
MFYEPASEEEILEEAKNSSAKNSVYFANRN